MPAGRIKGMPRSRLRVNSAMFSLAQFVFRVCLRGALEVSPTSDRRQNAPLKWLPVEPIRIVFLIANYSPLWRPPFSRQNCIQNREANQISPQRPRDTTLNTAMVLPLNQIFSNVCATMSLMPRGFIFHV